MRVMRGEIEEPRATRLTWRSPHEGSVDLSRQAEPALLRLHYHPCWSSGTQASLSRGPAGWTQVTGLLHPEQPLAIHWKGTIWQQRGEPLRLLGHTAIVAVLLIHLIRRKSVKGFVERRQIESNRTARLKLIFTRFFIFLHSIYGGRGLSKTRVLCARPVRCGTRNCTT